MLKVTFGDLTNPLLQDATRRLYTCTAFGSVTESYAVGKICKAVDLHLKEAQEEWNKLIEKYARKDEAGKVVLSQGQPGKFEIPDELSAEFQKNVEEFNKLEFQIECEGLTGKMLDAVKLSPAHLDAIECLKKAAPLRSVKGAERSVEA